MLKRCVSIVGKYRLCRVFSSQANGQSEVGQVNKAAESPSDEFYSISSFQSDFPSLALQTKQSVSFTRSQNIMSREAVLSIVQCVMALSLHRSLEKERRHRGERRELLKQGIDKYEQWVIDRINEQREEQFSVAEEVCAHFGVSPTVYSNSISQYDAQSEDFLRQLQVASDSVTTMIRATQKVNPRALTEDQILKALEFLQQTIKECNYEFNPEHKRTVLSLYIYDCLAIAQQIESEDLIVEQAMMTDNITNAFRRLSETLGE